MECSDKILARVTHEFDWHLTNACNFSCDYCFPALAKQKNRPFKKRFSVDSVVDSFDSLSGPALINMSGGEPFLYPRFVELCARLAKRHFLVINTNLSIPSVTRFADMIPPSRVSYIWAALHVEERLKRVQDVRCYVEWFLHFQQCGFPITAIYVVHPRLVDHFESDVEFLRAKGIRRIGLKVFKGIYEGLIYPESYEDDLRRRLTDMSSDYRHNKAYLDGERDFRGQECVAGKRFFKIGVDGTAQRCASDTTIYGNLFEGTFKPGITATPCRVSRVLSLSQCLHLRRFIDHRIRR